MSGQLPNKIRTKLLLTIVCDLEQDKKPLFSRTSTRDSTEEYIVEFEEQFSNKGTHPEAENQEKCFFFIRERKEPVELKFCSKKEETIKQRKKSSKSLKNLVNQLKFNAQAKEKKHKKKREVRTPEQKKLKKTPIPRPACRTLKIKKY